MSNDSSNSNIEANKIHTMQTASNHTVSSADNVDQHLQQIENNSMGNPQRPLSPEEQLFTEEELARLINPDKLKALMSNGDDFLGYLTGEIDKFEDF